MVYKSKLPSIELPKSGIIQFIFANKNISEDKPVLIDAIDKRFITYGTLKDSILRFAAGLQDVCDFKNDDVMALYAPNQYNYSIPLLGAVAANGATTPANPNYNVEELAYQLEMTKAKVIICHEENMKNALVAAEHVGIPRKNVFIFGNKAIDGVQPFETALMGDRRAFPEELTYEQAKEKVAYLCFSSGTTGKSKGVMTTHLNITANTCQYIALENAFIDPNIDRMIGVLPFFHIFGLTIILHSALYLGIPVYILPRFDLVKFCETIQNDKITYAALVPPIYLLLAKHEIISHYNLSSFRIGISGAAPLSADLGREVKTRLPHLTIKQGYGLTETSPSAIIEPTNRTIDGSTGILLPNMFAKVVDENGNDVHQGERGELWLKGPNIMKGYINNPEATSDCIDEDGYFHTGDVVIVDKDEHFYIVDRIKELIKYKGFQVPPAELEGILLTLSIVADCAVIGVYDNTQATELPRAYITLKPGYIPSEETAQEIMKYVADRVVPYKQIRSVRFIDVIPKSASGKILRRVLRDTAHAEEKKAVASSHKSKL
ncbi:uncharacterized protein BX663DRAFT_492334 [Cokeromyces recurvatus]|uniref:uncharacterized protein n=1 Tax=Cokeromyces recurvatus TaxID=90255 RepID=UPI00221F44C1|nr:uncharacterized protein BX663DRAFT_492334 [Cokeromyces recurvatus]KAI7907900.1 hypothetical protein BX663DRAFT_492334 [Cokeromyces recurvatus]